MEQSAHIHTDNTNKRHSYAHASVTLYCYLNINMFEAFITMTECKASLQCFCNGVTHGLGLFWGIVYKFFYVLIYSNQYIYNKNN